MILKRVVLKESMESPISHFVPKGVLSWVPGNGSDTYCRIKKHYRIHSCSARSPYLKSYRSDKNLYLQLPLARFSQICRCNELIWFYWQYDSVSLHPQEVRERRISPKFFRPKFFHGRLCGMSVPQCLFFQDLEGLTEVFDRMSAGTSLLPTSASLCH